MARPNGDNGTVRTVTRRYRDGDTAATATSRHLDRSSHKELETVSAKYIASVHTGPWSVDGARKK